MQKIEYSAKTDIKIIVVLLILVLSQAVLSFIYPAFNKNSECWRPITSLITSPELKEEGLPSDVGSSQFLLKLTPNYHMICDDVIFLRLVKAGFPNGYQEEPILMTEPLYPFFMSVVLGFLSFFFNPASLVIIFVSGIIVNIILISIAVILFYWLIKDLFSRKIAIISNLFLIFSPLTHIWLSQTTTTGILEVFVVVLALWLLYQYIGKPGFKKLMIYSILFGILMLGKMLYALVFFVLFLGWYFQRKKEAAIFALVQLIPLGLWYGFIKFGLEIPFYVHGVSGFGIGVWLFDLFYSPGRQIIDVIIESASRFFRATIFGFLLIPVIFSIWGLYKVQFKDKAVYYFGFIGSFFVLFFIMNIYFPRLSFMMFPIIYPTAAVGLDKIPLSKFLMPVILGLMFILSSLNVYQFIFYG